MHRIFSPLAGLILLGVLTLSPIPGYPSEPKKNKAPAEVQAAIDDLFSFAQNSRISPPDMQTLAPLLAFVDRNDKHLGESFSLGKRHGSVSDYYEFTVQRSLKDLLALVYNPELPSALACPASMRRSHWIEVEGKEQPLPRLSRLVEDLNRPLVIRGKEFIENTPDTNAGGYYAYDVQRTLILTRFQGRPLLISISVQPERSDVGRKGLVVGPDEAWNYVYTGEKGCMLAGLGWADSYMYFSASIMVYLEMASAPSQVRCAGFKWIRAGWAGMNLVKPQHIRKGMERFATAFKEVLESPRLPDISQMTRDFGNIDNLSTDQLREKSRVYLECLSSRDDDAGKAHLEWLKRLSRDQAYLQSFGREELLGIVSLEYLKSVLGKPHCLDSSDFAETGP
jgi:hypothetical protein